MKVYQVPLTLAEHDSDIKIKACTNNSSVICNQVLCYNLFRYQVSVYRTIGPLVFIFSRLSEIHAILILHGDVRMVLATKLLNFNA